MGRDDLFRSTSVSSALGNERHMAVSITATDNNLGLSTGPIRCAVAVLCTWRENPSAWKVLWCNRPTRLSGDVVAPGFYRKWADFTELGKISSRHQRHLGFTASTAPRKCFLCVSCHVNTYLLQLSLGLQYFIHFAFLWLDKLWIDQFYSFKESFCDILSLMTFTLIYLIWPIKFVTSKHFKALDKSIFIYFLVKPGTLYVSRVDFTQLSISWPIYEIIRLIRLFWI